MSFGSIKGSSPCTLIIKSSLMPNILHASASLSEPVLCFLEVKTLSTSILAQCLTISSESVAT